jgi:hypothetical protein
MRLFYIVMAVLAMVMASGCHHDLKKLGPF